MNLFDLEIYKKIYEIRSLNKTASILGYSQSNITARLKAIEDEFNTLLFIRNNSGVSPTENGHLMYKFVTQTLIHIEKLKAEITNVFPKILISELLFNFLVIEQKILTISNTTIISKKTSEMDDELQHHSYDYVITFNKLNKKNYNLKTTDTLSVCFFKGYLATNEKKLPILINSDLKCPLRKLTLELYNHTNNIIEVDSLENIMKLVLDGEAISLLPKYVARKKEYKRINTKSYEINYYKYDSVAKF